MDYFHDTSQICRRGHDDVFGTRMVTLAITLFKISPLDVFLADICLLCYPLKYLHANLQICRKGHEVL